MDNPYPNDYTISKFIGLYTGFLEAAQQELTATRSNITKVQEKLDTAEEAVKVFEKNIWERLNVIIKILPVSECSFCGGTVVDKSPLKQFTAMFAPYPGENIKIWHDFWKECKLKFVPECTTCGIYRVSVEEHSKHCRKRWLRTNKAKTDFVTKIFLRYPFVLTIGRTRTASAWFLELENKQYWRVDASQDEIVRIFNLPSH
jgi:hypothetical protein